MADQVNPTGNLVPGLLATTLAVAARNTPAKSSQAQESPPPSKPAESAPSAAEGKVADAHKTSIEDAVQEFQDYLKNLPSNLQFQADNGSGIVYFKVINPATGEIIRQVPSEEVLAVARKLRELAHPKGASGVLLDKEG